MPAAPVLKNSPGHGSTRRLARYRHQLHREGWLKLEGGMPEWELVRFVERLHVRYHQRLTRVLDEQREDWFLPDCDEASGPGAHRPGGLAASMASKSLEGTGIYVYAAHPSQADEEDADDSYTGPRWYVSCMEAAMRRYLCRGMAPPPPAELQELLWPDADDRCRPWLTEVGWTIVPEGQDPQVLHADICSAFGENPRKQDRGRYHHFGWKLDRTENCTTHIIPQGFTEGSVEPDHYNRFVCAKAPAMIFDSEMLHRGAPTRSGAGWSATLTIQVSSGSGWPHLAERVSEALMWYTQPLGWVAGDAVDALVEGAWRPALVESRDDAGLYAVTLATDGRVAQGLRDRDLRYRQARSADRAAGAERFALGELVEARFDGEWYAAKVTHCNADGTYRVTWKQERSCTDGLEAADLRRSAEASHGSERPRKRRRRTPSQRSRGSSRGSSHGSADQPSACTDPAALRTSLVRRGWIEFTGGLPESWAWALFDFVELHYDLFADMVIRELDSLREVWSPCEGSHERHGAFAAMKVSERLQPYGIAVYSPGQSQEEGPPYRVTGPRWYISVTAAAIEHYGIAPAPPADLHEALFGHPADATEGPRARGLGWTLAPPGSDPQSLHADIWGVQAHARTDRTRWPHILWKRARGECCTTQIVPGAFTEGGISEGHYPAITRVRSPAAVLDSEMLHRGAATLSAPLGSSSTTGWKSTLSLELCSPSGWDAWEAYATGGTTKDPTSPLDWRMLRIHPQSAAGCGAGKPALGQTSGGQGLPSFTPELPAAPWASAPGMEQLRAEQARWELLA